jgi:UDP-N-acetylmuramate dehydrogenase
MDVQQDDVEVAAHVLGDLARRDVPLAPMTTYRVGGPASLFVDVASVDDLRAVAAAHDASGLPVLVVGRGSNLLVADAGFRGIAISVAAFGDVPDGTVPDGTVPDGDADDGRRLDDDAVIVEVGGGAALPVVARRTAAAALSGFEWAVGVPGSVGGAVRMNAGGHGADIAGCLVDVDIASLDAGAGPLLRRVPADELGLRFRGSDLTDTDVVVRARLLLRRGDRVASEARVAEIVRWRREHQPGGQNCGSVFVNPIPGALSAGELVDGLGLRGLRIGTAHVSEKHANFVQASDGGTAADVRAVIEEVRARVAAATGIELRSEVRLVGFPDIASSDPARDGTGRAVTDRSGGDPERSSVEAS